MRERTARDQAPGDAGGAAVGRLPAYGVRAVPRFPGLWRALGPGIVWMALAQGSGELIWWPYIVAKYGLGFLFLLVPACLLQYPLNYQIGFYTLATGETVWQGFVRLNRWLAAAMWMLMTLSLSWLGGFLSSGAMATLTDFPGGWSDRSQQLFWAYALVGVFLVTLLLSRVMYRMIELVMLVVAVVTVAGLVLACLHPRVLSTGPEFFSGVLWPRWPEGRVWDAGADATRLLTAITFAGLGGFWTLFYSYWLREKGAGMAGHFGHITGLVTGKVERIHEHGFVPDDTPESRTRWGQWRRYLLMDNAVGVVGNLATTLMTCWLAYALLFPQGLLPTNEAPVEAQRTFFEASWGRAGGVMFLVLATAFLADTWLTTIDAVSRVHTDIVRSYFPRARRVPHRTWYWIFVLVMTVITCVTLPLKPPGTLILISAVLGFVGTVTFSAALLVWNHIVLPRHLPAYARPGRLALVGIITCCVMYTSLAVAYLWTRFAAP